MYNFDYHIPTKIFFGKGQIVKLPAEIKAIASKILLVYGGGSIKRKKDEAVENLVERCFGRYYSFRSVAFRNSCIDRKHSVI